MLTEVVVELEDEIGALADLGELLGGQGVNIRALAVVHVAEGRALAHLVVEPADVAVRVLREHGLVPERVREVLSVTLEDEPGALGRYCRQLADASINLEAVYLAGERNGAKELVLAVSDLQQARGFAPGGVQGDNAVGRPGASWLAWRRLCAPGRRLAEAATVRPAVVNPGRSAAPLATLLEDVVEGLARTRFEEVVQEQDDAGDRQQDRGGDDEWPIHGGGSFRGALWWARSGTLHMPQAASTTRPPQLPHGSAGQFAVNTAPRLSRSVSIVGCMNRGGSIEKATSWQP